MKKSLFIMVILILSILPAATVLASPNVNVTGEIDMKGEHSTFSDGEVSEEEWNEGLPGGSEGSVEPGADEPSITDQLGNLIGDLWDDAKDIAKSTVDVTWDAVTDLAQSGLNFAESIGESISNAFNSITEWFNNLPDIWQDALLTLGAVVIAIAAVLGAIAIGAAIIAGGFVAIPAAIVIGVVAGAALVGTGYFALNGGTNDFSFSHALMWAMGGGAVGAFLGTSAGGAVVTALARKFAPKFASEFMLILKLGGRGMAVRFLAGAWLKSAAIPMAGLLGFHGFNYLLTGQLPMVREFASDAVLTMITAPVGGHLGTRALGLFKNGKVFSGLLNGFAGMNIGGLANFMMGAVGSGQGTWADYFAGMATAGIFMGAAPFVKKYLTNANREIMFDVFQKYVGNQMSNLFKRKQVAPKILHSTVNTPANTGATANISQLNQSVNADSSIDLMNSQNSLTQQELEALTKYLNSMQVK